MLTFTGFSFGIEKENILIKNHQVTTPLLFHLDTEQDYAAPYFSEELCVIPKKKQTKTKDVVMTSKASLLINDTDGVMLYSDNIYEKIYPASITKIVTTYVTLKYANLEDTVTVSYNASHITEPGAVLCGLQEGDQIVLKDLLYCFLLRSGNDAGVAIAEHVGGTVESFAGMMNEEVKKLGAVHSHFVNPHGLHHDDHYTTAYDLYLIFHRLTKEERFLKIIHQPDVSAKITGKDGVQRTVYFRSTNRYLLGTASAPSGVTVIGGKTGTTYMAGSCLILYSQNASGKHYISVVLKAAGSDDLYTQMTHLLAMER